LINALNSKYNFPFYKKKLNYIFNLFNSQTDINILNYLKKKIKKNSK
jgi:hypothetical protein